MSIEGRAFPVAGFVVDGQVKFPTDGYGDYGGLTARAYIATRAMAAIIGTLSPTDISSLGRSKAVSFAAVEYADALLERLER